MDTITAEGATQPGWQEVMQRLPEGAACCFCQWVYENFGCEAPWCYHCRTTQDCKGKTI
jgi:hypothetical protein